LGASAAALALTGGGIVARALFDEGVTHAFTVPGESFMGLLDAIPESGIRLVAARHEAGAGFMAEAFGQLTNRPAACLVTRAVGAANLAIALHTARQDSTPLVAIAGQVPRAFRGREAFQEVDLVAIFGRLCKEAVEVQTATDLAVVTRQLVRAARAGRPGPVLLSVPEDVFDEELRPDIPSLPESPGWGIQRSDRSLTPALDKRGVEATIRLLGTARRPVIVAGAGVARSTSARAALVKLADRLAVPVVASWRRPDAFPNDHPLYLGMAGLAAPKTVRRRLEEADVLLALGTRLSEITTFGYSIPADSTRLMQVDPEPGFPGGRPQPELAIRSDPDAFLTAALRALDEQGEPALAGALADARAAADERRAAAKRDRAAYEQATTLPSIAGPRGSVIGGSSNAPSPTGDHPAGGVHPATVVRALGEALPARSVLTTDAGNFAGWAARYLPLPREGRFLGPTSGAMGYALPAAIGAAIAEPDRPVVALAGDGGFAMLMAELETAVREKARLVAIVFDNRMYGTIRMHQEQAHPGRIVGTELGPIDFAGVAGAMGARGVRVESDDEVAGAIGEALGFAGVSVVHVHVDRRYLSVDTTLAE
jgi:acetolactate synthase-1/2/3 large subunit